MTDPSSLEILRRGEHISAQHYKAVTEAARQARQPFGGYCDVSSYADRQRVAQQPTIVANVPVDILRNSVFQLVVVGDGPIAGNPITIFDANLVDTSTYRKVLVTNEGFDIVADTKVRLKLISTHRTYRVRSDASDLPFPIQQCGPVAGSSKVSRSGGGLLCLSNPDYEGYIDVIGSPPTAHPTIHFIILNFADGFATCEIVERTCGGIPQGLNDDGTVYIYDTTGCYFNELAYDLIGRHGWADYVEPWPPYSSTGCYWSVNRLCCPTISA